MSILQDIYKGEYSPTENLDKLPQAQRVSERAFWDAVENEMGAEFAEFHRQGFRDREQFHDYVIFREGFRLGISLVMELQQ